MKTKIIYISGNELFEISEIRAAFEEVRKTLGLDKDTILFGVPVDTDNAILQTNAPEIQSVEQKRVEIVENTPCLETASEIIEPCIAQEEIGSDENDMIVEDVVEISSENNEIYVEPQPNVEEFVTDSESETVIPILSVLGGTQTQEEENIEDKNTTTVDIQTVDEIEVPAENTTDEIETDTLKISIEEVVAAQVPVEEKEKTLEELLESMTPLGEDLISEPQVESADIENDIDDDSFSVSMTDELADTDATLAQLANEFAQTQDQIPETPKASGSGKISKLKNILPFKKAKRDDNGLMGDLFGWAGIAANDEDFSIPGFFTSAGGQK